MDINIKNKSSLAFNVEFFKINRVIIHSAYQIRSIYKDLRSCKYKEYKNL